MISNCKRSAVILLCGVPGVGKTTLCKKLCDFLIPEIFCNTVNEFYGFPSSKHGVKFGIFYIEFDFIYRQLVGTPREGGFDPGLWKKTYLLVEEVIKFLFSGLPEGSPSHSLKYNQSGWMLEYFLPDRSVSLNIPLHTNFSEHRDILSDDVYWFILLDDNFMYDSMRRRIFNLCRPYGVNFLIFYMITHHVTCLQRLSLRDDSPPLQVFESTLERFESPKRAGTMGKHVVLLNSPDEIEDGALSWNDLFYLILSDNFVCLPLPTSNETSQACNSTSEKHQFDLLLRKAVSNIVQHHSSTSSQQQHWKRLSKVRKQLLKDYEWKWRHLVANSTVEYWETILCSWNRDS